MGIFALSRKIHENIWVIVIMLIIFNIIMIVLQETIPNDVHKEHVVIYFLCAYWVITAIYTYQLNEMHTMIKNSRDIMKNTRST